MPPHTSIVLPVHNQEDHIERVVDGHLAKLSELPGENEVLLVTNACTDRSPTVCGSLAERHESIRHLDLPEKGYGRAVRAGLDAAEGEVLCYANSARTTPEILTLMLAYAFAYPEAVLKVNRRIRQSFQRRLGSLLYNIECRILFDLAIWDVNGTPKVFPRSFDRLLELRSDGDLVDVEFAVTCKREDYPIIEVPILTTERQGGKSGTNYGTAVRLYLGAYKMSRSLKK